MKNKRIGVKLGKTLNMGDYEFLRVDVELSLDIKDETDTSNSYKGMFKQVKNALNKEIRKQKEEWK